MPSGSRKRKSLKKPKAALDERPELEPGLLEESMTEGKEEIDEGLEEGVLGGTQHTGETSEREEDGVTEVEEVCAPDSYKASEKDPPGQTELQDPPSIASEREMGDTECETDGKLPNSPQVEPAPYMENKGETSYCQTTSGSDAQRGEIKPGLEQDADLSDASPINIETGLDFERSEAFEAPSGNEPGRGVSFAKKEWMEDVASEDREASIDTTFNEQTFPDREPVPAEIEQGVEMNTELPEAPPVNTGSGPEEKKSESLDVHIGNETEQDESRIEKEKMSHVPQEEMGQDIATTAAGGSSPNSEPLPAEIKLGVEQDRDIADAPSIDIEPGSAESGLVPPNVRIGNEPESDEPSVRREESAGIAEEDLTPGIYIPLDETAPDNEVPSGGVKQGVEPDVELADSPPVDIEPTHEREPVPLEVQNGNESELAEPSVEEEFVAGVPQEDNVSTPPDGVEAGVDQGFYESPETAGSMEAVASGDGQPENMKDAREAETCETYGDIQQEGADITPVKADEDPDSIQSELNESVPKALPEAMPEMDLIEDVTISETEMSAAPVDSQAELDEDAVAPKMAADAHLESIEAEATDDVETAIETDEDVSGTQSGSVQETDQGTETHESNAQEIDTDGAGNTDADAESALETGKDLPGTQSDITQATDPRQVGTLESDAGAIEPGRVCMGSDVVEMEQPAVPRTESEIDAHGGEGEASREVPLNDVESEDVSIAREGESELETSLDDSKRKADPSRIEVTESITEPEVHATLVDTQEDEALEAFAEPQYQERAFPEPEPDMVVENVDSSMEVGAEAEPERPADTSADIDAGSAPTSEEVEREEKIDTRNCDSIEVPDVRVSKDIDGGAESCSEADMKPKESTIQELEQVNGTEPVNEAPSVPLEESGSKDIDQVEFIADVERAEQDQQDGYQQPECKDREIDSALQPPEVSVVEPEAESEFSEMEPEGQDVSELNLDRDGHFELDPVQQDVLAAERDQLNLQNDNQEAQIQEGKTDPVTGTPEVPASDTNQEQALPISATAEAGPTTEEVGIAIADSGLPAHEQQMLDEKDRACGADTVISPDDKGSSFDAEQSDELKESHAQQEVQDTDDTCVERNGSSGDIPKSTVPIELQQDLDVEQPSTPLTINDKVALTEETHEPEVKSSQPTVDKQELSNDPSANDSLDVSVDEYEPNNWMRFEQERGLETPSGDLQSDIGEEEAVLSTAAEAGSAIADFDENPTYEKCSSDSAGSEQGADISERRKSGEALVLEGKESNDLLPTKSPDLIETRSVEHVDDELADGGGECRNEDSLKEEVEWKAAQNSEPPVAHEDDASGTAEAEITAPKVPELSKVPADVRKSEQGNRPEDVTTMEAGDIDEHGHGAVPAVLGDKSTGKSDNGEPKLSTSKATHSVGVPVGEVSSNTSNGGPPQVASVKDMNDTEALHQQKTRGAPVQDVKQRDLDLENLKGNDRPSSERTLQRRNLLGCCGMFDLLLGKN